MKSTPKQLLEFYYEMLRIRLIEEKIADLYSEQEMRCPVHLCIGQEAIAVGVCAALKETDAVLSAHRSHGHYLAKGGSLQAMLAEIYGKETGCCRGKGGSMHLVDLSCRFIASTPIVGSTIPIAAGVAWNAKIKNDKSVTAVFFGEAATEQGVFHEAINFAALKKIPILFVCENNFYSVYSPLSVRQPKNRPPRQLAKGHGVETFHGYGNDADEVYRITQKAVSRIRQGKGPVFLEFETYRWREHCGPNYDNDIGYRTPAEFKKWEKQCPLKLLRAFLLRKKYTDQNVLDGMKQRIETEINEAIRFAKESAFPAKEELFEAVYHIGKDK